MENLQAEGTVVETNFEENTVTVKLDAECKAEDWQTAQVNKTKVKLST